MAIKIYWIMALATVVWATLSVASLGAAQRSLSASSSANGDSATQSQSSADRGTFQSVQYRTVQYRDGDRWRYRWHNGRWWYWMPEGRWVYWSGGGWRPYVAARVDGGYYSRGNYFDSYPRYRAGYRGYYPPRYYERDRYRNRRGTGVYVRPRVGIGFRF